MGPQHDSCGRLSDEWIEVGSGNLQWGRNMIVAEGVHVLVVSHVAQRPSMGPQHDSCGRVPLWHALAASRGPSMGPQHDSCGRRFMFSPLCAIAALQWGRNMIVAEGRPACSLRSAARITFNGAAT